MQVKDFVWMKNKIQFKISAVEGAAANKTQEGDNGTTQWLKILGNKYYMLRKLQ